MTVSNPMGHSAHVGQTYISGSDSPYSYKLFEQ